MVMNVYKIHSLNTLKLDSKIVQDIDFYDWNSITHNVLRTPEEPKRMNGML